MDLCVECVNARLSLSSCTAREKKRERKELCQVLFNSILGQAKQCLRHYFSILEDGVSIN